MQRILPIIAGLCATVAICPLAACRGPRPGPSTHTNLADTGVPSSSARPPPGPGAGIALPDSAVCSNAACTAANDGQPATCVKERGACVSLLAGDCYGIEGPWEDDRAVLLAQVGAGVTHAAALAIREINQRELGLAPSGSSERRPIVLLQCALNPSGPEAVLTHLIDDLGVPGIIGPGNSAAVIEMSQRTTPAGALVVATSAGSPQITELDDRDLVWRISPSHGLYVPAMALMVSDLERKMRDAGFTDTLRVALILRESAYQLLLEKELMARLRLNGYAATDATNASAFKRIAYPDQFLTEDDLAPAISAVATFGPHIVLAVGAGETMMVARLIEARWTHPHRPEYVLNSPVRLNTISAVDLPSAELATRIRGVSFQERSTNYPAFARRYEQAFPNEAANPIAGYEYDAACALAYATASAVATAKPLSGATLTVGMKKLTPPGMAINVGPDDMQSALAALSRNESIDLEGVTGNLDFDVATGEPSAERSPIVVWCPQVRDGRLEFLSAGQSYDRANDELVGTFHCPTGAGDARVDAGTSDAAAHRP